MKVKTCGLCTTTYKPEEHDSFGLWGSCPVCALAKALGYKVEKTEEVGMMGNYYLSREWKPISTPTNEGS